MKHKIFNVVTAVLLCLAAVNAFAQNDIQKNIDEYLKRADVIYKKYSREQDSLIKLRLMSVKNSLEYDDITSGDRRGEGGGAVAKGLAEVKSRGFTVDESIDELAASLRLFQARFKTRIPKFKQNKTATYSYPVTKDDRLIIQSRFGNITINTWDKNEIKVDVQMTGFGENEAVAKKALEFSNALVDKQDNVISLKPATYPFRSNEYSGSEVDYTIYMPADISLSIANHFGDITLPDLKGAVDIDTEYGTITAKNLSNAVDDIKGKFTAVNIQGIQEGKVSVSHGSLNIANAGTIQVTTEYSPVTINSLLGNSSFNLKFANDFKLNSINKNVKALSIDASYSSLIFTPPPTTGFNFTISGDVQDVMFNPDFKFNKDKMGRYIQTGNQRAGVRNIHIGHYGARSDTQVNITTKASSILFQ